MALRNRLRERGEKPLSGLALGPFLSRMNANLRIPRSLHRNYSGPAEFCGFRDRLVEGEAGFVGMVCGDPVPLKDGVPAVRQLGPAIIHDLEAIRGQHPPALAGSPLDFRIRNCCAARAKACASRLSA